MNASQPPADEPTAYRPPEETPTVVVGERSSRNLQFTPGTILGGRYRIVSLIGRGGMGEVYRADDLKVGHTLALKFLSHREHAQRLYEEVRIGRQISHPNVCRLYDVGEVDGQLFISMEYIDGEDLGSLLRRVGRLPPEKGLAITRDICGGVAAAHERGVIHRDLKPANVMIDGGGRARVTDFGLAVAGERATDSAGTPAYMSPERLAGEAASVASDLYALGLVLYEVFTGRRPFSATSAHDLLMRQRANDFVRPTSVARDVPAAVERVILRCLDPDPKSRPSSVGELMRDLPGGDPLADAIAAGETPTPGMVAAAARIGDLRAPAAWLLLAVAVIGFLAAATLSERTLLNRLAGMKSPDVLEERARQILAQAGVKDRPGDADLFVREEPLTGQLIAVYRQSLKGMFPRNPEGTLLTFDPTLDQGMANVELDTGGRLRSLLITPPVVERRKERSEPEWEPFLSAAGYDPRTLIRAEPEWTAAIVTPGRSNSSFVDSDAKTAWLTGDGRRIEAAAYHGRPVFFSVITPEAARLATAHADLPASLPERVAFAMFVFCGIAIPMAALAMARINLRRRQGDRRGALRAATGFFIIFLTGLVFQAHHSMQFIDEWILASWNIAEATFWALITALMYLAIEPFVRKRWPQILISWARLLSGRLTDPMVGRDVLTGAATAAIIVLVWQGTLLLAGSTTFFTSPVNLGPPRFVVCAIAYAMCEALLRGVGLVVLLVTARVIIPSDAAASLIPTLLIASLYLGDSHGPLSIHLPYAILAALAGVLLARRLGLLTVMSYHFFTIIQQRVPLTLEPDAWYFGRSAMVLLLLIAVVALAFRISLGAKRWLPRLAFD
jgi:serine/threonine-protein kinase